MEVQLSAVVIRSWPKIDARRIPLETAKTLVAEAGKFLEAQQRGLDSLRARLLDVARQATTLATVLGGLLIAATTGRADLPAWAYVSASTAFLFWAVTALLVAPAMLPGKWFYAGRVPLDWWKADLLEDEDDKPEAALLAMAKSSNAAIEHNEAREDRMARWLSLSLIMHVSAAPAAAFAAAMTIYPMWTALFLAFVFAVGGPIITALRSRF